MHPPAPAVWREMGRTSRVQDFADTVGERLYQSSTRIVFFYSSVRQAAVQHVTGTASSYEQQCSSRQQYKQEITPTQLRSYSTKKKVHITNQPHTDRTRRTTVTFIYFCVSHETLYRVLLRHFPVQRESVTNRILVSTTLEG